MDLEDVRSSAKQRIDDSMMQILRRLEGVQKRLYREVDEVVDARLRLTERVRSLIGECDRIAAECGEALSWKNAFDPTAAIAASNRLNELLVTTTSTSVVAVDEGTERGRKRDNSQHNQTSIAREDPSASASAVAASSMLVDEMKSALLKLHKTLELEVESKTKRFALDESDLNMKVVEQDLEIPVEEYAAATSRFFDSNRQLVVVVDDNDDHNPGWTSRRERERELQQEGETIRTGSQVSPKHFYDDPRSDERNSKNSPVRHYTALASRESRAFLLGTTLPKRSF